MTSVDLWRTEVLPCGRAQRQTGSPAATRAALDRAGQGGQTSVAYICHRCGHHSGYRNHRHCCDADHEAGGLIGCDRRLQQQPFSPGGLGRPAGARHQVHCRRLGSVRGRKRMALVQHVERIVAVKRWTRTDGSRRQGHLPALWCVFFPPGRPGRAPGVATDSLDGLTPPRCHRRLTMTLPERIIAV